MSPIPHHLRLYQKRTGHFRLFVQRHIQENPLSHEAVQGRLAFYKHKTSTHLEIFLELQNSFSLDELPDNLLERFQTVAEEFKRHHENVMLAMSELTVRFFLAPPPKIPNMSISETDHFQNALKAFLNSLTVENGIEGVSAGLGDCSVCSESLEPSTSPVIRLSCHDNHVFHKDCIMVSR